MREFKSIWTARSSAPRWTRPIRRPRVWVDRAIAVDPNNKATYLGSADGGESIAQIFSSVGDDPALADYMQQGIKKFPDFYALYPILTEAQDRMGRTADLKATATALIGVLNTQLKKPGADVEGLTLTLAQAYCDAGDAVNGTKQYQGLISAYPTDPTPANNLAYADAVANTNLPAALALAQKAITLAKSKQMDDAELGTFQDTLGWVQYRLHDYKKRRAERAACRRRRPAHGGSPLPSRHDLPR